MTKRVAIVTGGTRGIGGGISELLSEKGCKVIANYGRDTETAAKFSDRTGIESRQWDVSDFDACQNALAAIVKQHGPIAIVINNAGITRDGTLKRMSYENWMAVLQTNLTAVFNMVKGAWPHMETEKFGRIVNISSVNGQAGQYGQVNYCAAKAGVIGMTKALALEGARHNITANTVAPGYVKTDMVAAVPDNILEKIISTVPVGRLGDASEIARAVWFLVREDSNFITGATISINGGQHMY